MKFISILLLTLLLTIQGAFSQQESTSGQVVFHDIKNSSFKATLNTFTSKIDLSNKTIEIKIPLKNFKFDSKEGQNDFTGAEKMNMGLYPELVITGIISSNSEISNEGRHIISIEGEAVVKGKKHVFKTNALLVNKKGQTVTNASFLVNTKDFGFSSKGAEQLEVSIKVVY